MKTIQRLCMIVGAVALAAGAVLLVLTSLPAQASEWHPLAQTQAPVRPLAAPLPSETCTLVGTTRTCELWAKEGTLTLPNTAAAVPIWGFTDNVSGAAQLPGPVIAAYEGETLAVVFHNTLAQTVSLAFPGQMMIPDLEGVPQNGSKTYTFTVSAPGTYLYEAGLTPNGARQVAMGLFGGLVIRPALGDPTTDQAYADAGSAYDQEALLIFSELDPAFNNDPMGFSMEDYRPQYWLINGKAYPDTESIAAGAGDRLLLRLVNGGVEHRSIGLLGLRQTIVGLDGESLPATRAYTVVAESIPPGSALDSITMIPTDTVTGTQYALYNTALQNHNANWRLQPGNELQFGGMMTFVAVTGTVPSSTGPVVTEAYATPDLTTGDSDVTLSFVISATSPGNVIAAEMFINDLGAPGTGEPLAFTPAPIATIEHVLPVSTLATWSAGHHSIYVRGQDADGWGAVGAAILNLDKAGPDIIGLSLLPNPVNGTRPVILRGTADDHSHGNSSVTAASYGIGVPPHQAMTLNLVDTPVAEISALIPAADLAALAEGQHMVTVEAQDALGNTGTPETITLDIDLTGPETGATTLTPATLDLSGFPAVTSVRLDAQIADPQANGVQSHLVTAEAFIDTVGAPGTGFPLFPSDGLFDESSEDVYYPIPITTFALLAQGDHSVWVRGRDAAGNWGTVGEATITIDRGVTDLVGPTVSVVTAEPNPTAGAAYITLVAHAADPDNASNIAAAEWFVGTDPGPGFGYPMQAADGAFDDTTEPLTTTVDISTWNNGNHRIWVRAQDASSNWGDAQATVLRISNNAAVQVFADSFDSEELTGWSQTVGDVTLAAEAHMSGETLAAEVPLAGALSAGAGLGMRSGVVGEAPSYVSLQLPSGERDIDASFYFNPNSTTMGQNPHDILVGLDKRDLPIFGIQVARTQEAYQVRAWVRDDGAVVNTPWIEIGNQPVALRLQWEVGAAADFALTVGDTRTQVLVAPNTQVYRLNELRLGPSNSLYAELTGAEYFDEFRLNRTAFVYLPAVSR